MASKNPLIQIIVFTLLVWTISWLLWTPRLLVEQLGYELSEAFVFFTNIFAPYGPSIIGLILARVYDKKEGLKHILKRTISPKFPYFWVIIVIFLFMVTGGISYVLTGLIEGTHPVDLGFFSNPISIIPQFFLILVMGGSLGEEYGWRGFFLPKLMQKLSPIVSSVVLGVIWGIWHWPLFFFSGTTQSIMPIWQYLLITILISIIYTVIFQNTGGNLGLMILLHTTANLGGWMFPYWTVNSGRYISFVVTIIVIGLSFIWINPKTLKIRKKE